MNSKTQTELNKEMHDEACADLTKTNAMLELIKNNSEALKNFKVKGNKNLNTNINTTTEITVAIAVVFKLISL